MSKDYIFGNFKDWTDGFMENRNSPESGNCRYVNNVNIGGYGCINQTITVFYDPQAFHIDGSSTKCQCNPWFDNGITINNEDNFGQYHTYNNQFSCANNNESTTNYWIGQRINVSSLNPTIMPTLSPTNSITNIPTFTPTQNNNNCVNITQKPCICNETKSDNDSNIIIPTTTSMNSTKFFTTTNENESKIITNITLNIKYQIMFESFRDLVNFNEFTFENDACILFNLTHEYCYIMNIDLGETTQNSIILNMKISFNDENYKNVSLNIILNENEYYLSELNNLASYYVDTITQATINDILISNTNEPFDEEQKRIASFDLNSIIFIGIGFAFGLVLCLFCIFISWTCKRRNEFQNDKTMTAKGYESVDQIKDDDSNERKEYDQDMHGILIHTNNNTNNNHNNSNIENNKHNKNNNDYLLMDNGNHNNGQMYGNHKDIMDKKEQLQKEILDYESLLNTLSEIESMNYYELPNTNTVILAPLTNNDEHIMGTDDNGQVVVHPSAEACRQLHRHVNMLYNNLIPIANQIKKDLPNKNELDKFDINRQPFQATIQNTRIINEWLRKWGNNVLNIINNNDDIKNDIDYNEHSSDVDIKYKENTLVNLEENIMVDIVTLDDIHKQKEQDLYQESLKKQKQIDTANSMDILNTIVNDTIQPIKSNATHKKTNSNSNNRNNLERKSQDNDIKENKENNNHNRTDLIFHDYPTNTNHDKTYDKTKHSYIPTETTNNNENNIQINLDTIIKEKKKQKRPSIGYNRSNTDDIKQGRRSVEYITNKIEQTKITNENWRPSLSESQLNKQIPQFRSLSSQNAPDTINEIISHNHNESISHNESTSLLNPESKSKKKKKKKKKKRKKGTNSNSIDTNNNINSNEYNDDSYGI